MHLRDEIRRLQSQLKSAIQNHQMIVFKLKDRPVSTELRVQMNNVQRHIVSLGERQKKLLQELRRTLELSGEGIKQENRVISPFPSHMPSPLPSALLMRAANLNVKKESIKKENFENDVKNSISRSVKTGDTRNKTSYQQKKKARPANTSQKNGPLLPAPSPSRKESTPSSTPSSSPTPLHGPSRNSKPRSVKQVNSCPPSSGSDESQDALARLPIDPEVRAKLQYMSGLGLITREALAELQSRRTERKRRSTANPQFLYGNNMDHAMKRKKTNYLFSNSGVAPDHSSPESLLNESRKLSLSSHSSCVACLSNKGTMTKCASCFISFHWNCVFIVPQPEPGSLLKCKACLKKNNLSMKLNAEKKVLNMPSSMPESVSEM